MCAEKLIVIVGAGPTGLGAAWRLNELGHDNWLLLEENDTAGGLAGSVVDSQGFTWDLGGHVVFSHYPYFDQVLDDLLGESWVEHVRESWIWMRQRFIPYPLQQNIRHLPVNELTSCLYGLLVNQNNHALAPTTFYEWIIANFGHGLAESFFLPYNRKVWAYDPDCLATDWVGERVAKVDLLKIVHNILWQKDELGWGPNAKFRYPRHGGTGAIWRELYRRLPEIHKQTKRKVISIDSREKQIRLADGSVQNYDCLISTIPKNALLRLLTDRADLLHYADSFKYSSTHVVGIGLEGQAPDILSTKCWMYFPEPDIPFYRATILSNYSPYNVPSPGKCWSIMVEVSESQVKPVDITTIVEDVVAALKKTKLMPSNAKIMSSWHIRLEYGYPTPFLGRDEVLVASEQALKAMNIWSRGRFGAWKYEVSNQDHSFMQGVEAVDNILSGSSEKTYECLSTK